MNQLKLLSACFSTVVAAAVIPSASASPMVSIGENIDVFFDGSTSVRHMSNVFRSDENRESDVLWVISPGLDIRYGGRNDALGTLGMQVRYDILRYDDNSFLNTENLFVGINGSYRSARVRTRASASFEQVQSPAGQTGLRDLVRYDRITASVTSEYEHSPKISFDGGLNYSERKYKDEFSNRFSDSWSLAVPVNAYYELTPKIDASVGYRYRYTKVDDRVGILNPFGPPPLLLGTVSGYHSNNHFLNVGLRGEVLPKVTGSAKVGYIQTNPSGNRSSQDSLGFDLDLTWAATPKISTTIGGSRDFGISGEGNTTEDTSLRLMSVYELTPFISLSGNLGYTRRDYSGVDRTDDIYTAGLRTGYRFNTYWLITAGYTFEKNDSNSTFVSYENHIFDLSLGLRY